MLAKRPRCLGDVCDRGNKCIRLPDAPQDDDLALRTVDPDRLRPRVVRKERGDHDAGLAAAKPPRVADPSTPLVIDAEHAAQGWAAGAERQVDLNRRRYRIRTERTADAEHVPVAVVALLAGEPDVVRRQEAHPCHPVGPGRDTDDLVVGLGRCPVDRRDEVGLRLRVLLVVGESETSS